MGGDDYGREISAAAFSERDSAGVLIVESSGNALETTLPWVVDTVPSLELGQGNSDPALQQFHDIGGIVALPNGGLVVVDGGSRELRWFDAAGEHVRTLGGSGAGPGEFLDPLLVPRFQRDSLLIFDRRRRAFTWIAIDGSGVRALARGGPLFTGLPRASAASRALFASTSQSDSCIENEPCDLPLLLRWVDLTGTKADTLAVHIRQ
jgi:hypothetical protein